jgi:diguanylate cyclase (GGDEF)-like protein
MRWSVLTSQVARMKLFGRLPNRLVFGQAVRDAVKVARRYGQEFAVMFVDLDRFKIINDTLGHAAGDSLLTEVANRLK